jgi:hypothetical protein
VRLAFYFFIGKHFFFSFSHEAQLVVKLSIVKIIYLTLI